MIKKNNNKNKANSVETLQNSRSAEAQVYFYQAFYIYLFGLQCTYKGVYYVQINTLTIEQE